METDEKDPFEQADRLLKSATKTITKKLELLVNKTGRGGGRASWKRWWFLKINCGSTGGCGGDRRRTKEDLLLDPRAVGCGPETPLSAGPSQRSLPSSAGI
jgi:hypothetical protein